MPEPIPDGFLPLLDACFLSEEFVAVAPATENDLGEIVPTKGVTSTREEWKERVQKKGGIERCFSTKLGVFIRINPMREGGSKNEDVTAFRHVLVEFDREANEVIVPKEEQIRPAGNPSVCIALFFTMFSTALRLARKMKASRNPAIGPRHLRKMCMPAAPSFNSRN